MVIIRLKSLNTWPHHEVMHSTKITSLLLVIILDQGHVWLTSNCSNTRTYVRGLLLTPFSLVSLMLDIESEQEAGESEEDLRTPRETTPPPSGPSGLVIFGQLLQKHSYVSGLIIMMVNSSTNKNCSDVVVVEVIFSTQQSTADKIRKIKVATINTLKPLYTKFYIKHPVKSS